MARLFISFDHEDESVASSLRSLVTAELEIPSDDIFLSSDRNQIGYGERWLKKIRAGLESCEVFLCLLSESSVQHPWINFETGAAWIQEQCLVIPVCYGRLSPAALPQPYAELQAVQIPKNAKPLIQRIRGRLGVASRENPERWLWNQPGLDALAGTAGKVRRIIEDPYRNLEFTIECRQEKPKRR